MHAQGGCNTPRQNVSRETLRQAGAFGRLRMHCVLLDAYEGPTRAYEGLRGVRGGYEMVCEMGTVG